MRAGRSVNCGCQFLLNLRQHTASSSCAAFAFACQALATLLFGSTFDGANYMSHCCCRVFYKPLLVHMLSEGWGWAMHLYLRTLGFHHAVMGVSSHALGSCKQDVVCYMHAAFPELMCPPSHKRVEIRSPVRKQKPQSNATMFNRRVTQGNFGKFVLLCAGMS